MTRILNKSFPWISVLFLGVIVLCCLFNERIVRFDPTAMDLYHANRAPGPVYWFGTDHLGRDLFSMIWKGGSVSLRIGFFSAAISGTIGVLAGVLCGMAPPKADALLLKIMEVFLSIPSLLLVVLIQSLFAAPSILSLSLVIGLTGWTDLALTIRMQVRQLKQELFYQAAHAMGAGQGHLFLYHLFPHIVPSVLYMTVMSVRSAILYESTLSFMGLGIPIEVLSWGSMLSMADQAFLSGAWWIMIVPGVFLVGVMICLTQIGEHIRSMLS